MIYSIALLFLFIFTLVNAQDNEHYFQFKYNHISDLDKLTQLISIDDVRGDTTVNKATRNNANNIDLNRNFPDRVNDPNNTTVGRQLETKAMMGFIWKHNFTLSANFHGGAQVVNYPWDNGAPSGTYSASPDDAWFIKLSRIYATPNPDIISGGFTNGITNGCKWYAIYGGRQDWIYWWIDMKRPDINPSSLTVGILEAESSFTA